MSTIEIVEAIKEKLTNAGIDVDGNYISADLYVYHYLNGIKSRFTIYVDIGIGDKYWTSEHPTPEECLEALDEALAKQGAE